MKDVDINQVFKLNDPPEDSERFLSRLRQRFDNVDLEIPTVEVRYENLKVQGEIYQGSRAISTLPNTILNFLEIVLASVGLFKVKKTKLSILDGVNGTLKPGRFTLLLGPPASGKTTFLLALAGQLDSTLTLEGKIEYNGYSLEEFEPRKTASYVSQNDLHTPELTVRETMDYSARFQGIGGGFGLIEELINRERENGTHLDPQADFFIKGSAVEDLSHDFITEYCMKIMGLDICANTIVGDQMRRGISGGQKKRLTTGEMIVGPSRAFFMDEISNGLDSTTAFQVVKCFGHVCRIFKTTVLISLLQPAPETYELFDDIILFSGGHVVYHGPLDSVQEFFETCGFKCPERKAVPDFLQEVMSIKDQEQYWVDKGKPYKFVPVMAFVEAFKKSHAWNKMNQEMAVPLDKSNSHPKALSFNRWAFPQWELFKINFDKEILILKKNWIVPVVNLSMLAIQGSISASLFFRTEMHHRNLRDAQHYNGELYFIINQVVFTGFAELTFTAIRFPLFHKLREIYFCPPWTWALSLFIIKIPFAILEALVALTVSYYIVGFAPQASRFFKLWLLLAISSQMASGIFRMLAGFCRTFVIATSMGGFFLVVIFVLGGYIIPRNHLKDYMIWGYWAFPLSYIENGAVVNEFLAPRWRRALPNDLHTVGHRFIVNGDLFDRGWWFWFACAILIVYTIGFYFMFAWAITFLGLPGKSQVQISEDQLLEIRAQLTGEGIDEENKSPLIPRSLSKNPDTLGTSTMEMLPETGASSSSRSLQRYYSSNRNLSSNKNGSSSAGSSDEMAGTRRGMILPFQPLAISFKNINYFVDLPSGLPNKGDSGAYQTKLQLLRDITGSFRPGVLTALVGVTGAGKSTMMDVLAGRKTRGYIEGDIYISGFPKKQETFARISGYCEQNDIHSPQATVHEALIFSAWLRLQPEIGNDMKKEFVQQVMDLVELTPLKDAIVGLPGESGLSTEQRKRLTIAVELVANPSIIFMDEPTSGLDARAAATVMRAVRNTVDTGRTVVCTIHQPSIDIFESFDELFLLKVGGEAIYAGHLGKNSRTLIEYFQGIDGIPKIKEKMNPAAWMLEITTPGMEEKLQINFAQIYKNSSVYQRTNALVEELSKPPPNMEDISFPHKYAQSRWIQFTCCLWKVNWTYWRTPSYNLMRFGFSLAVGLLCGSVFWGMGKKITDEGHLYSLLGAIYTTQIFNGVLIATAVQPLILAERTIFYRERSAGMYSEFPYAMAQCLVEIPYILAAVTLYSLVSYSMIKLKWEAKKFFWYLFFFFCSQLTFAFLGFLTVALSPAPELAAIVANFCYGIWNIFSGFIVPHPQFPQWWKWIFWADPLAYHIYGVIASQFGDITDVYGTTPSGLRTVKEMVRSRYGYKHSFLWFIGPMSIVFPVLFAVLYFICIKHLNYQQR